MQHRPLVAWDFFYHLIELVQSLFADAAFVHFHEFHFSIWYLLFLAESHPPRRSLLDEVYRGAEGDINGLLDNERTVRVPS